MQIRSSVAGRNGRRLRRRPWLTSFGLLVAVALAGAAGTAQAAPDQPNLAADQNSGAQAPLAPPDAGLRPSGSPVATPPGTGSSVANLPAGSPGAQLLALQQNVQTLSQQSTAALAALTQANTTLATAKKTLDVAKETVKLLEGESSDAAGKAYKDESKVPDKLSPLSRQLRDLSKVAPWLDNSGTIAGREHTQAVKLRKLAQDAYDTAVSNQKKAQARYTSLKAQYDQAAADLAKLQNDPNAANQLAGYQNWYNGLYAGLLGSAVHGYTANPRAIQAVQFALGQLGKPYVWGAAGPNAYDCSGLVLASYQSVGVSLPRVADDQYRTTAGQSVPLTMLLPGDLLFYGTSPGNSYSIYHVAMYIGGGKMVQAPDYGIPVEVTPVQFGQLYGATRVLPAVKVTPSPNPSPQPSPSPSPRPSSPSPSPSPSPSSSSPSPSPSPSKPSRSPSASCSPSPSASSKGAASSSDSASPSDNEAKPSPSVCPTPKK